MLRSFILLFFLMPTTFSVDVMAVTDEKNIKQIKKTLDNIKKELARKTKKLKLLEKYKEEVRQYLPIAKACKEKASAQVVEAEAKIKALGEPVAGEATDISKSRKKIEKEKNDSSRVQGKCSVIEIDSHNYIKRINLFKQSLLAKKLSARGLDTITLIRTHWINHSIWDEISFDDFMSKQSGLANMQMIDYVIFLLFVASASMLGVYYRNKLTAIQAARQENIDSYSSRLTSAFITTSKRYVAFITAIYTATLLVWLGTRGIDRLPFIAIVTHGLTIVVTLLAVIHWFLHASLDAGSYTSTNKANATSLARRLKVLVFILFFGYILFRTIIAHSINEPLLLITRGIYAAILILNLLWIVWLTGKFFRTGYTQIIKFVLSVLLITALMLEWVGYRNLSTYIIIGIIRTSLLVVAYRLISSMLSDFYNRLDTGEGQLAEKTRALLSTKSEQKIPGLVWIRLITTISIWSALLFILIKIWQIPESYTQPVITIFTSGFHVGSFNIAPQAILGAILTLSILLFINSWFKRKLEKRWLPKTAMVRSARESMAAVSGYIGASIAIVVALGVAGLDLSKLALIAGALSVGIGFGLQNIVNNFISGLILLFERPIKTGDWIVVDDVEGYVKRISIRSTHIQTFDRADVIVPNSALISGKVVNWMLKDIKGRIRVPIGVAYGSDVQAVKKVLHEIADEHPEIIKSKILAPAPVVLFIGFGDSSLDFELRCHIRDIDKKVQTTSDLNFAIDAAFRAQKIEIPFPQRDIHIIGTEGNPATEPIKNKD